MPRRTPQRPRRPSRVVIEGVRPQIDCGRFPIKRVVHDVVTVEADVFTDGHDGLVCRLLYRHNDEADWQAEPMVTLGNDRWRASFAVSTLGPYRYTVEGWIDTFGTWRKQLITRIAAGQEVGVEIQIGAGLIRAAARRATGADREQLEAWARSLGRETDPTRLNTIALDGPLAEVALRYPDRSAACRFDRELEVVVDPPRARFSTWYELFPRSCALEPGRHGTFGDVAARLPDLAAMGFDVVYLPPIHPIGRTLRKGRNNAVVAGPDDVGSPWAIGAEEGGHTAIHPQLGTLDDFRSLIATARGLGIDIALDLAYQCSPDHPYVKAHPEWFRTRPDGTVQYAENPPKKYQDIYPFDFDTADWQALWDELRRVIQFWVDQGVRIFRVDNPHTKTLAFWEWAIATMKARHPDLIFLAEAFTRPRPMYRLAKLGFTQSYTYFTWRTSKAELTDYFQELTATDVREFFRPNLWPNTPDILHASLQTGGRPAFMVRAVLAATLGASYGIYGPAFELCERIPREPGSEEYLDSEKYELRQRDLSAPESLRPLLTLLNRVRRDNAALQTNDGLIFHDTDNPQIICYSKTSVDRSNVVVVVVNLDVVYRQSGWVALDVAALGLDPDGAWEMHDLMSARRFDWRGTRNYVELTPGTDPAHVFHVTPLPVPVDADGAGGLT
jgi:starch synthase (maltosyl-transferring)